MLRGLKGQTPLDLKASGDQHMSNIWEYYFD